MGLRIPTMTGVAPRSVDVAGHPRARTPGKARMPKTLFENALDTDWSDSEVERTTDAGRGRRAGRTAAQ
jgi:hypothetical protein